MLQPLLPFLGRHLDDRVVDCFDKVGTLFLVFSVYSCTFCWWFFVGKLLELVRQPSCKRNCVFAFASCTSTRPACNAFRIPASVCTCASTMTRGSYRGTAGSAITSTSEDEDLEECSSAHGATSSACTKALPTSVATGHHFEMLHHQILHIELSKANL